MHQFFIKLYLITLSISVFSSLPGMAQEMNLSGKIIDASNNEPVEFANLGVVGTFLGTASDLDGNFSLEIDEMYVDFTIRISAVGYQPKEVVISQLRAEDEVVIKLAPASYGISQVDVMAQSKVLHGIIKSSVNLITENYFNRACRYSLFVLREESKGSKKQEAIVTMADESGYGDRSYSDAFTKQSYEVDELRRNYEGTPVKGGLINLDDLLLFDVVRVRGNVLDTAFLDNYEFELKETVAINEDSVWVIAYKSDQPMFASTGEARVKKYHGVVYISKNDHAVLRNELNIESDGYFQFGRTAFADEALLDKKIKSVDYRIVTTYRKEGSDWMLSRINLAQELHGYSSDHSGEVNMKLVVLKGNVVKGKINPSEKRDYFSNKEMNEGFWDRFTLPE
ncbi:carboxypeptidase-like regulatory domain-containing protein [Marinilabiliaceae bacterium JC017]|nr:carboxypeptidase-like regulatory domain-containing protein [Marinilabiliaceae bacterium JC017]